MKKILVHLLLFVSIYCPAQIQVSSHNCSNVGGGTAWNDSVSGAYSHGSCRYALRPDGHGTIRIVNEVGVSTSGQDFLVNINLPPPLQIQATDINLVIDMASWCVGSSGALLTIDGTAVGPIEALGSAKSTLNVPTGSPGWTIASKTFSIQRTLQVPIQISSFLFYHFTDGCAVVTYN